MKKLLYIFFVPYCLFSQNLNVEYNLTINRLNDLATTTKKFTLEQTPSFSLFSFDNIRDKKQFKHEEFAKEIFDKDSIVAYIIGDDIVEFFFEEKYFKDFAKDLQIYNFKTGYTINPSYVKESLSIFDWQIDTSKDTLIAGYICKKAETKFRGRQYMAYFTNEIANQGGPWKFDGLPGFILSVVSKDGYLSIEPSKILLNKTDVVINNPFDGKKTISFDEVKDIIVEQDKKMVKKMRSRPNPPDEIKISKPDMIEDIGLGERVYE